jgi:hypothetical protein
LCVWNYLESPRLKNKTWFISTARGGRWLALLNSSYYRRKNFPGTTVHEFRHPKTLFEGYNTCMEHSFTENFIRSLKKKNYLCRKYITQLYLLKWLDYSQAIPWFLNFYS